MSSSPRAEPLATAYPEPDRDKGKLVYSEY